MRTEDIRSEALESFIKCFNLCYPDWEVEEDTSTELTADHVEYSYTTANLARCGPRDRGHVYFAIKKPWYGDATPAERLGLLIHELAHVKETNHHPEFWEQVINNYRSLSAHSEVVEEVMVGNLSWPDVREYIVTGPHTGMVDNRQEIVYERRRKLADALDYPVEEVEPFEEMTIKYQRPRGKSQEAISLRQLEYTEKDVDDVIAYFHRRPREYLSKRNSWHTIQPLPAKKRGTIYEIVEGHEMATLAKLAGLRRLTVRVMEDSSAQESTARSGSSA